MALPDDLAKQVTNTLDTVTDVTGTKRVTVLASKATTYLLDHAAQFIGATCVMVIGIVVTGWVARGLMRYLERRKFEPPESLLIIVVVRVLLIGLTILTAWDVCGYSISAVIAGSGALVVGAGLALQGLLGNIIAGMTLIFTKPFRVGEYIEILGSQGLVTHIDIISTTIVQMDHSKIVIPNHKIAGEVLRNFGSIRQVNVSIGIGYQSDLKNAMELAHQALAKNPRVLHKPAPIITIGALRDSAVALSIKSWVKAGDIELAEGELNEAILENFRQNKIEIPFPRRDIYVVNAATPSLSIP